MSLKLAIQKFFWSLPYAWQAKFVKTVSHLPGLPFKDFQHARWLRETYLNFSHTESERIFLSIASFAHINRPIEGYYFEFGCNEAKTMRRAWDAFHRLFNWTFVGFDSFQGLPPVKGETSEIFYEGNLAITEAHFRNLVISHGMPADRLITVPGFYDTSLTPELQQRLLPQKAAVVYIDCDLYLSTVPCLEFIKPFLQPGTVIVFDDWNCFHASPDKGERRAWAEFRAANPELQFVDFVSTAEAQCFIFTGLREVPQVAGS